MTLPIHALLLLLAVIFFALATAGVPSGRFNMVAAGLLCWLLAVTFAG